MQQFQQFTGLALIVGQILLAYTIADALSGIYHLLTDRGWNIRSQVAMFQNHHERPWTMTFDLQPIAGAIPLAALAWFVWPWFFGSMAVIVAFAQAPHYFVHHPERSTAWIAWLQRWRLVIPPRVHESHHRSPYNRNYCIISGWNDWWLNWLLDRYEGRYEGRPA